MQARCAAWTHVRMCRNLRERFEDRARKDETTAESEARCLRSALKVYRTGDVAVLVWLSDVRRDSRTNASKVLIV